MYSHFKLFFCNAPFTGPPIANGVDEREHLIEKGITQRRFRGRLVQWSERVPPHFPFGKGPNRGVVSAGRNQAFQWFSCIPSGYSSSDLTTRWREGILNTM